MTSADNLRKALGVFDELKKILWKTPHETLQRKTGNKFPVPMAWVLGDELGEIEKYLTARLQHVEVVGRVKGDTQRK